MTKKETEKLESIERLREIIRPGDTIHTILRHRSASGMSRSISLIKIHEDGGTSHLDYHASRALGYTIDQKNGGIKVGGAGMDMGYHLVYNLGRTLFPTTYRCNTCGYEGQWATCPECITNNKAIAGFECIGQNEDRSKSCPSNDHVNGDRNYSPDHIHSDGGYALRHRWL